jgi:transcriptional regulator with XRE-family HTH domain
MPSRPPDDSRHDADISQRELAQRLHVTRNTIANMESGGRLIEAAELPIIAKALGTSMETLTRRIVPLVFNIQPITDAAEAVLEAAA